MSQSAEKSAEIFYECHAGQDTKSPEPSGFLSLPVEIREQIYGLIFHPGPESRTRCLRFRFRTENKGCQCGNGISLTNRQLYIETRFLFYEVGDFIFGSPVACKRFIQNIRHYMDSLTSLDILYQDTFSESSVLREIFAMFTPNSKLHSLRLRTIPYSLSLVPESPPIYFPSYQKASPAAFYDLSFRPVKHPLATMLSIRSLTVVGNPGSGGIDEALLKLRLELEKMAVNEHKSRRWTEAWHVGFSDWEYTLEIAEAF